MFNLDDIELDLDDDIFDLTSKRFKNSDDDCKLHNEGKISFGVDNAASDSGFTQSITQNTISKSPPNILRHVNNERNIKECKQSFLKESKNLAVLSPRFHRSMTSSQQEFMQSPSYSPITSTQKPRDLQSTCLFDKTNSISPIKIKPGLLREFNKTAKVQSCNRIRKFPGPAGYLPKIDTNEGFAVDFQLIKNEENYHNFNINHKEVFAPSTQQNELESWKRAKCSIGPECWPVFENYCLGNVFKMISLPHGLPNFKIPVLCLRLVEVEYLPRDAAGTMSDNTGSIKVAIHRPVLQQYKEKIKTGAVFILKKVSIFSPSGKKYFLNITQSNVVDVFCSEVVGYTNSSGRTQLISQSMINALITECNYVHDVTIQHKPDKTSAVQQGSLDFDDDMDEVLTSFMDESFPE